MANRLPPLNAVRAFEATARHLSVKHAADELCVTPGAVSQMVKTLERHLGVTLFERVHRGIALTDAGQTYLPPIRNAFRQIADATRRVAAVAESGVLTVSVTPSFAASWLVPRLKRFRAAHPDIDLQIQTAKTLVDFARDGVDIAVRHGLGRYLGLRAERVFAVELVPVAAPTLIEALRHPAADRDLVDWPHLHDSERQDWHLWFQALGIDETAPLRGPAFDDTSLLIRAALDGQGAALVPSVMVTDELQRGALRRLSDAAWPESFAYYLVYPEAHADRAKLASFRDWVLREASPP